jgi:aspartate/tyrosine/aromatic aminotransferase
LSIPNEDENWVKNMNDFLGSRVRKLYSVNPRFGSDIIRTVLNDPKMRA